MAREFGPARLELLFKYPSNIPRSEIIFHLNIFLTWQDAVRPLWFSSPVLIRTRSQTGSQNPVSE